MFRTSIALLAVTLVVAVCSKANADEPKPPELTEEEQKLSAEATRLNQEGVQLYQRGQPAAAVQKLLTSLELCQKLYSDAKYPDGHPDLATSLNNLGFVLHAMGQAEKAEAFYQKSLDMKRKLYPAAKYPDGHSQLALGLNSMGLVLMAMGQAETAASYFQQSLDMKRKLYPAAKYPDGHQDLALGLNNLGGALDAMGLVEKAATFYQQSLDMRRKLFPSALYPEGHHDLASSLNNLGFVLQAMGQAEKASIFFQQSLDMNLKLYPAAKYPDGHPDLALSLNNLGGLLESMGQAEKAATFLQQSLDINRKLYPVAKYPDGHPDLALSLHSMAFVLQAMGQAEKAAIYCRQSLDMVRKLFPAAKYPDGHPYIARSLNNLGALLAAMGQVEKAATFYEQSLAMHRRLYPAAKYPDGQPHLATSLNNMGYVLMAMGQAEEAATFFQQSLEMHCRLYPVAKHPDGHPHLAESLNNLGIVLQALGQAEKAATFHRQSLEMQQRFLQRELLTASESAALDRAAAQPLIRDAYLSATRALNFPARECYQVIASSRSRVTRILEQRLAGTRVAGTAVADQIDQLKGNRRRTDQLLQYSRTNKDVRDKLLVKYADERDTLERELIKAMPLVQRGRELDQLGPADLAKALPSRAVFIDIIRYTHFEYVDKKQKRTPSYVAFIVLAGAAGTGIVRVELGDAASIDSAITAWRAAIDQRKDVRGVETGDVAPKPGDTVQPGESLRKLVWDLISKRLPSGTKTLYIAPDGDLARMPWAALPVGNNRVLLEDFEIAVVPHGVFLLDHLKWPRKADGQSVFALGGVDYGASTWPKLPGTLSEMNAIAALAPGERETASQGEANVERVSKGLTQVRYAHIATHGFFDADGFAKEKKREDDSLKNRQFGDQTRRVVSKNPLGFVGLVLADGKVMSGLSIIDLQLEKLQLVTLSACETGLGQYTFGEGVQGLARAFHVAGCPNVITSLWKVSDAATAALMAKFYHELWVNKKPPLAALREAQLFIYYNPDKIPDVLGERGAPKRTEALAIKGANPQAAGRADTKLWAAFVLSGVGR